MHRRGARSNWVQVSVNGTFASDFTGWVRDVKKVRLWKNTKGSCHTRFFFPKKHVC